MSPAAARADAAAAAIEDGVPVPLPEDGLPPGGCGYERYDARTLAPANPSTYTRLIELGWDESTFAGRSVLDVGGGAGLLAVRACRLGATDVLSVDVQRPLVDYLAGVAELHGLPIRAERRAFAELEAPAHEADVVLCMETLHWVVSQGAPLDDAIAKLASLTRDTLYLETPWDVAEPSLARSGALEAADYDAELVLRALGRHFERVGVVRFMTYFGRMPGSRRVLLTASGRRPQGALLGAIPDAQPLDVSLSRGSNPSSMLASPDGVLVLKTLPPESILADVDPAAFARFAEHLESAEDGLIVAPLPIAGRHVAPGEDGRHHMLFPFVGDLAHYYPVPSSHDQVVSALGVALRAGRAMAGLPRDVVAAFRRASRRVRPCRVDELGARFVADLERLELVGPLEASFARMVDYPAELEDAVVHHDMQLGNMLTDPGGRERLLDLDLVRSGPVYSDILTCAAYSGAGLDELRTTLDGMRPTGVRPPCAFDVDFSLATILKWARAVSDQGIELPDAQHEAVMTGLVTLVRALDEVEETRRPEPACFALAPDARGPEHARAAVQEAERLDGANGPAERVRDLCLLAMGAAPRDAGLHARLRARLEALGYTGLSERLEAGAPTLEDLRPLLVGVADPVRLFEPVHEGYRAETLLSCERETILSSDNAALGDAAVEPSDWVARYEGARERPRRWERVVLRDARVFHHDALFVVLDDAGRPVESVSHPEYRRLYLNREFLRFAADPRSAPAIGRALYVQDTIRTPNYAHWLLDTVPRMRLLGDDDRLVLYRADPGFVRATLEAMGVGPERVVELAKTPALRVARLEAESSVGRDFFHPAQKGSAPLVAFVRGVFGGDGDEDDAGDDAEDDAEDGDGASPERIYLSRNRSDQRRLANEHELLPALEAHGFATVYAEEHSMAEQAGLFRRARIIVAPHGAALANIVFSRTGCSVFELFEPNYGTASFYVLANRLGLRYYSMRGEGAVLGSEERARRKAELQKLDLAVDAEKFRRALERIVARSD